ncbi:MAG: DinB family protein [Acidobacteria bacterium]|nr:DinB family protein [Acidobacteriota bacterium]MCI0625387.1 DinB family protein [Acidobacteriota bacterium]MCI0721030.1 DinB family protein [Acidobacteriota bacterium]
MKTPSVSQEIEFLLWMLDEAYSVKTWHGPNLKGSLRGLGAAAAAWRPGPKRHSIWEIAVHAAYWKYVVRRRLLGEKRGSFALTGSNWFTRPAELTEKAWREDRALLDYEHTRLKEAVANLEASLLSFIPATSKLSNVALICGIANHDVYHAGQIQLLKRLRKG